MPGDCQSAVGGEVRCPDGSTISRLRKLVHHLKEKVGADGSGDSPCPKPRDVCCERAFRIRPYAQFRVTVDGQVVEPLPEWRQQTPLHCPPCQYPRPPRDPGQGCYRPVHAGAGCPRDGKGSSRRKAYASTARKASAGGLGQSCAQRSAHSVCSAYQCPPEHTHWSPECTDCAYPNACRADCTKHPTYKDWTYRQPSYRFYLQKRDDKPFMLGY